MEEGPQESGPQQQGNGLKNGTKALSVHLLLKKRYYICSVCQYRNESKKTLLRHMGGRCKQICPDCKNPRYITEIQDEKIYKCSGSCKSDHQLKLEEIKHTE